MKALAALLLLITMVLPTAFAVGYGTSSISVSSNSVSIAPGSASFVDFTVNLASGNTWGTTLQVRNSRQLKSEGITTGISNAQGEPPYSGTINISVSPSAVNGTYPVVLEAIGDDPSINSTTLDVVVGAKQATTTTIAPVNTTIATTLATTIATSTTMPHTVDVVYQSDWAVYLAVAIVIIAIVASYLIYRARGKARPKAKN